MSAKAKKRGVNGNGNVKKRGKSLKIVGIIVLALLFIILALLTANSLLNFFLKNYYPTFGNYRIFAVVSDSIEEETDEKIQNGNLIIARTPNSPDEIEVGTIITYEFKDEAVRCITGSVSEVYYDEASGAYSYTTELGNPAYSDVVGIFTGKQCRFLGFALSFLQSLTGTVVLVSILLIFVLTVCIVLIVKLTKARHKAALNALRSVRDYGAMADDIMGSNADYSSGRDLYSEILGDDTDSHSVVNFEYDDEMITVDKVLGQQVEEGAEDNEENQV